MTPEQEERFRRAWINQNRIDVIKKPKIAHMHNQDLLKRNIKKRYPSTKQQKISERSRRINILLHKKLDVTTIADLLGVSETLVCNIIKRDQLPIEETSNA
jgi:DNA-directed RNA polymerase specialized sigma subunit|tara:strand:- start:3387 stop:3689 length:303 start_codon:yes stop_codon:yes gene_type:complete